MDANFSNLALTLFAGNEGKVGSSLLSPCFTPGIELGGSISSGKGTSDNCTGGWGDEDRGFCAGKGMEELASPPIDGGRGGGARSATPVVLFEEISTTLLSATLSEPGL